jgi:hypothetical protein
LSFWVFGPKFFGILGLGLGLNFGFFGFLGLGLGLGGKPKYQTQNPMFFECQCLVGDEHILIDAIITSNKVFKVPKKKAGKFIIGKSNMTDNFEARNTSMPCTSSATKAENLVDFMTKLLESAAKNATFQKESPPINASTKVLVNETETKEKSDEDGETICKF